MPNAYGHGYGGFPPPGPYGQQGPAYGHQGYYDSFGNWVPYTAADYAQWGYGGAAAGAGAYGAAAAPPLGAKDDQAASGRGKGFAAKMGDRAQVKSSFTLEQRKARIGKGFVEGEGDEYGAEILVGGGGLVRSPTRYRPRRGPAHGVCRIIRSYGVPAAQAHSFGTCADMSSCGAGPCSTGRSAMMSFLAGPAAGGVRRPGGWLLRLPLWG